MDEIKKFQVILPAGTSYRVSDGNGYKTVTLQHSAVLTINPSDDGSLLCEATVFENLYDLLK